MIHFAILLAACTTEADDSAVESGIPVLEPPPSGAGFQVSMLGKAPAFSEVWLCEVYALPTTDPSAVNWVDYLQNAGTHHMTLSTTAMSETPIEPGSYDCADLYADTTLMQDVVMMFGTQGEPEGRLQLPEGVAANLPAGIQLLHEVHYVNTTAEDVDIYSYLNGWTIPQDEVVSGIWGGSVRDEHINIPPASTHTEWSRCVMNEDVEVQFLASHTHARGKNFTIAPFDGTTTGEIFFANDDWHSPLITQYNPGRVVPAGQGFEFGCTWENTGDTPVTYGLTSEDEMCNMAIVFTPFSTSAECEVVETSDGVIASG